VSQTIATKVDIGLDANLSNESTYLYTGYTLSKYRTSETSSSGNMYSKWMIRATLTSSRNYKHTSSEIDSLHQDFERP
jgi:hypothetical protein